jgi:hypothetical protein
MLPETPLRKATTPEQPRNKQCQKHFTDRYLGSLQYEETLQLKVKISSNGVVFAATLAGDEQHQAALTKGG